LQFYEFVFYILKTQPCFIIKTHPNIFFNFDEEENITVSYALAPV